MNSTVSGHTYDGSIVFIVTNQGLSGKLQGSEIASSDLVLQYWPASFTLEISRDTGYETIQKFVLIGSDNRFPGDFHNEGKLW